MNEVQVDAAVRRDLEAIYARLVEAYKANDNSDAVRFLENYTTPDFRFESPRGGWTRQEGIERRKSGQLPWEPSQEVSFTIDRLTVQGDEATVLGSFFHAERSSNPKVTGDATGKEHAMVFRGTVRSIWVKTATGWKNKFHESLDVNKTRDGEPFPPPSAEKPKS
jgi:hypothetical protein